MIDILSQRTVIRNPNNSEETILPTMPLVIALDNGIVAEVSSIRGLISIIIGDEYFDAEDSLDEWYHRLFSARKEAMKALGRGVDVVVYDAKKGVIKNNYAANPEDPDYEIEAQESELEKIHIETERLFLLSLIKLESIILLEREDSFQLRHHEMWNSIRENKELQCCENCLQQLKDKNGETLCKVYGILPESEVNNNCNSYAFRKEEETCGSSYTKEYIDIGGTYDVNFLMNLWRNGPN